MVVYFDIRVLTDTSHSDTHSVRKVADEVAHGATANPDRIVLTWAGPPSTSQAVTWRTDTTVDKAFAQIALAEAGPLFALKAKQITATTHRLSSDLGPAHYHTVNFQNLTRKTKYTYRVGDGTNWSEWNQFVTASSHPEPFTFIYFGDAQNDIKSHWSRVVREAHRAAPHAAFTLHAGDLVNHAQNDAEWGEWFYASGFVPRMIPMIATPGNHEYFTQQDATNGATVPKLSDHWRAMFTFPANGPPGLEETVYWIDYLGARIIVLNSNEKLSAQAVWLEQVLQQNATQWTIVTFHHPVYSSARGRDNPELRSLWQPLFDEFKVDLVLQGHDHTYARTELMAGDEDRKGTVYVVSVSGPKMYALAPKPFMTRVAECTQLYQIITVDGEQLRYEARTATGQLYDAFTLRKCPGEVNGLTDQIPDVCQAAAFATTSDSK